MRTKRAIRTTPRDASLRLLPWTLLLGLSACGSTMHRSDDGRGLHRGGASPDALTAVAATLDAFHDAAARADGGQYFALLADDAIFLGTDPGERWTRAEFQAFAEPYFAAGRGWTYGVVERHAYLGPEGDTAWFDERLTNESYGECRGTGALRLEDDRWRITQYNLTIPVPNDLAGKLVEMIREGR